MARAKRERERKGSTVSKATKRSGAGQVELFNGRCQMMVSSFYDANGERAELYAKQFFDDYKKLVPKEKFIESIAMSLEVCAEEGADTERMESAEEAVIVLFTNRHYSNCEGNQLT